MRAASTCTRPSAWLAWPSSGLLGIVHSMAHKTGAAFENGHIIHGAANAMYLGKAIQWNSKDPRAHERYAYVAKEILHLPGTTDDQLIDSLVQKIRSMNDELHIPQSINNYANGGVKADETGEPVMVSEKEFLEKLPHHCRQCRAGRLHAGEPAQDHGCGLREDSQVLLLR